MLQIVSLDVTSLLLELVDYGGARVEGRETLLDELEKRRSSLSIPGYYTLVVPKCRWTTQRYIHTYIHRVYPFTGLCTT